MSEAEKHVTITERCFDALHILQERFIVAERILLVAICFIQASTAISCDRDFSVPVHICGHSFVCPLEISNVHFHFASGVVTVDYETTIPAKCQITGSWWDLVGRDGLGYAVAHPETWYLNVAEHASPHSHTKTGLEVWPRGQGNYIIQIHCTTTLGESFWMPAENHYYWILTFDDEGHDGELIGIVDEDGIIIE